MNVTYYNSDISEGLKNLISVMLEYVGAIAFLFLVCIGIYYMLSDGNPERQSRAKNAFSYVMMGLILVLLSYSILEVINRIAT